MKKTQRNDVETDADYRKQMVDEGLTELVGSLPDLQNSLQHIVDSKALEPLEKLQAVASEIRYALNFKLRDIDALTKDLVKSYEAEIEARSSDA